MVKPAIPRSLLLTPIAPAHTGNGLAMRAAAARHALATLGEVDTVVVPVSDTMARESMGLPPEGVLAASWLRHPRSRALLRQVEALPQRARLAAPGTLDNIVQADRYDVIYVLRLYMAGTVVEIRDRYPEAFFL